MEFDTYPEARAYAERRVRETGVAHGIEKPVIIKGMARPYQGWTVKMVPGKAFRCGWELRCEVVEVE